MSLVEFYNEMTQVDDELKKEAAEMDKLAADEEIAGRFTARGFLDELNKLAQKAPPRTPTQMMFPSPKGPPMGAMQKQKQKFQAAKKMQETFRPPKGGQVTPEAAKRLNLAAKRRVASAVKMHEMKRKGLGYRAKREAGIAGGAIRDTGRMYAGAAKDLGEGLKGIGRGVGIGAERTGKAISRGAAEFGKGVRTRARRAGEAVGETIRGYGKGFRQIGRTMKGD